MIFTSQIVGNAANLFLDNRELDILDLDWFDTGKTTLRKKTRSGKDIAIRKNLIPLVDGDIIYMDQQIAIAINILPCSCIVFKPGNFKEMATICFEIGNKHIPLFISEDAEIIVEFEQPLFRLLERSGFKPVKENRKLLKTHALAVQRHEKSYNRPINIK
ncbi:urease accessory protein UreE [Dyadobacter flavalbus]|uniref:Urease accessory protein UreE n=1 Tax=Dyadobacter flavalbus TaxID=2579942 RepID=A0A5M8QZR6_9BACT|nr:urease accessory protein UreE [Dyadobacter flavalbus]KAA6439883.1 urease accessory protein UreE [Dyadobacter flavalbus]